MIVKMTKVFPLVTREYTDRTNQQKVFKSKGFVLHDGTHSMYAEAVQETADQIEAMNVQEGEVVAVNLRCSMRSYKASDGSDRYMNEITLLNLMTL